MSDSIYKNLDEKFKKLDKRNTKYQFDMEKDIEWSKIASKGRYFSDSWLKNSAIDIENVKNKPEILNYIEILFAFNMSKTFHLFETEVLNWEPGIMGVNAVTQSFKMLIEEEIKHVKVFQRYERNLSEMYPEIAQNANEVLDKILEDYQRKILDKSLCDTEKQYHYLIWLFIIYFEEYTVWFDTSLDELKEQVQPCWKQVHHCHRLEETQHVITDKAYIDCLDLSYEEKMVVSEKLVKHIMELFQNTHNAIYELVMEKFPNESVYSTEFIENSRFVDVVAHTSFKQTRSVAPYLEELTVKKETFTTSEKRDIKNIDFIGFLKETVATLAKCDIEKIDCDAPLTLLGLDSLGHLILASELEKFVNTAVVNNIPYKYNTINKLNEYFRKENTI